MSAVPTGSRVPVRPVDRTDGREPYVDLLRAASLLVVVVWHWGFTLLVWQPDGPHASNPIGSTPGLWLVTWALQVMPLFFVVGGYGHLRSWRSCREAGGGWATFVRRRLGRLAVPAGMVVALALVVRMLLAQLAPGAPWVDRGLILLLSPLWFLAVYVVLVLVAPAAVRWHDASRERPLVVLAATVVAIDLLRFRFGLEGLGWLNYLVVFGFCHQLGLWWPELTALPRRAAGSLALGGLAGLSALTNLGLYPRSMVGVPGEALSNMAPPTLCIAVLGVFQIGLVLLARERVLEIFVRAPSIQRVSAWANARAMSVFLWHFTGYAAFIGLVVAIGLPLSSDTDVAWWVQRPLFLVGPALLTAPLVRGFARVEAVTRGVRA